MAIMQYGKAIYRNLKFKQHLRNRTALSVETAEQILLDYLPKSAPNFRQKNKIDPKYDVMIIVPVYNVENYLEQCIESILNQKTNYTYQAVFVNDGSTDSSGAILDRCIPAPHVVIHKKNGGVSAARNDALRRITGRYLMFMDSDDLLEPHALERLVSTADEMNADIVEGSHTFFGADREPELFSHGAELCQIHHLELYGFPWGKVISCKLLEDFCFPEGYLFEDTVMATLLHPASSMNIAIPDTVYRYRDNHSGITHSSKAKKTSVDTFWITKYCLEERIRRGDQLRHEHYVRYLIAVRRNWLRTNSLPEQIQEAIFSLTCDLFERNLPFQYVGNENRMFLLTQAIQARSYKAYHFLMERWDIL